MRPVGSQPRSRLSLLRFHAPKLSLATLQSATSAVTDLKCVGGLASPQAHNVPRGKRVIQSAQGAVVSTIHNTYLLEFILAEKGFDEMFSSIGLFTDGIGTFEMPLS